jgi:hypothetical protein
MVGTKKTDDQFTKKEAQKRFEAALRGARVTGHKPMSGMTSKRSYTAASKKKKSRKRD